MNLRQSLAIGICGFLWGCASSSSVVADAGPDAGADAGPDAGLDAGPDAGPDGGPGLDAGDAGQEQDGGNVIVSFSVPAGGGSVQVTGSQAYTFTFPADVGGQDFTIEVLPPTSFGFDAGRFVDLFKLGPNGTSFTTPVYVAPATATNLPPIAMLFPEPVSAATGEFLFAEDGGYFIPHFSVYGQPGPPSGFCNPAYPGTAGDDYCASFSLVPPNGFQIIDDQVSMPGEADVNLLCDVTGSCAEIEVFACTDSSFKASFAAGGVWPPGGALPFDYQQIGYQACPAVPPPPGCQQSVVHIQPSGCSASATCNGVHLVLTCGSNSCSCSGGSTNPTFPQGATCANPGNVLAALATRCP